MESSNKKWVYSFNELDAAKKICSNKWDSVRALLGGKGANLADMVSSGIPVPPGFTVTTEACNAYLANGNSFPQNLWDQEVTAIKSIEASTGKKLGDPKNPLLVSCRSGAKFSMPGMMDTVLNIGLNDKIVEGLAALTDNPRFAYDCYRRLIQMYGGVVMNIDDEEFEEPLKHARESAKVENDSDLKAEHLVALIAKFKEVFKAKAGQDFPQDPLIQIKLATEAVFKSWNGKRAIDYRNATAIPHNLGTAVNIQTMVFGNLGLDSATGVAMTRNGTTGERKIEGDYLINAQGEDVVAGIRITERMEKLKTDMPKSYTEFEAICDRLEKTYRDMQDIEFTIERGKLWILQTRDAKRTAQAAVKIAADLVDEKLITKEEALMRVKPEQIDFFLHPQFDSASKKKAIETKTLLATGLNVSPGAAVGIIAFDADVAEKWGKGEGKQVIMVRPETKPDDVHGMLAAKGILTSRGGRTSHAALVARQFGIPAVVGVAELEIDMKGRKMTVAGKTITEGEWISIDGTTGEVFYGKLNTVVPDIKDPYLIKLLKWADEVRRLEVWANADYPQDAKRAREYGAQGLGLCRTEHMFFETVRLPHVQKMILASNEKDRKTALDALLPFQRSDFYELFKAMDKLPVVIRLIDPPLHEFLPAHDVVKEEIAELKKSGKDAAKLAEKEVMLAKLESMHESNPMLGLRGVRLGIHMPELTKMQVRAIFEAACKAKKEGFTVHPKVMIPLTSHVNELKLQQTALEEVAKQVMAEQKMQIDYSFGTMIEIPRAALIADKLAEYAQFFSFGTNDLTQTTYGISRDDAEKGFLIEYLDKKILPDNPFATIDQDGVGQLMKTATTLGRKVRPDMQIGICGEHGGEPKSVEFCHKIGLSYVSCSPFRLPIARLAAAQAVLKERKA